MSILIGHASISENGTINGQKGDQTKKEVCTREFYSKPWDYVAIHPDPTVREKHAKAVEAGCANDNIGYGQGDRNTLNTEAKKVNYDLSKVGKCNTDCSEFMNVCAVASGAPGVTHGSNGWTTSTMKTALKAAGYKIITDKSYLASGEYCVRGAIYVKESSHTVCALSNGSKAAQTLSKAGISGTTTAAKADPAMSTAEIEKTIWNFLSGKGLNDFAVAGIMGNVYAESALNPKNLQNSYEKKLNMTDEQYTAAVDSGSYSNFVRDSAGYGLAQWTYWSRKQALLDHAKSQKASIGDLNMQLSFLWKELSGYTTVMNVLKSAASVLAASNAVLTGFEKPADQSAAVQKKRAEYGQKYYDKYAKKTAGSSGASTSGGSVEYAKSFDKGLAGSYKVTASDGLHIRAGAGKGKKSLAVMPKGAKVQCYGYYTDVSGTKWLYITYKNLTGFSSSEHLKR